MIDARRAPRLPGVPLLGNALQANADPCRFFLRGYQRCGPVFRVTYPGRELVVLAGRSANALLARRVELFDAGATYARVTRELGTTTLPNAADGPAHARLRAELAPSLSPQALEPFIPRLLRAVAERAAAWPRDVTLRCADAVEPLVADLVGFCTASRPLPAGGHTDVRRYGTMMGAVGVGAAGPEWLLYAPPMRAARRRLQAWADAALAEHRAVGPGAHRDPDVFDALVRLGAADPQRFPPAVLSALALLPLKNAGIYLYRLVSFVLHGLLARPELLTAVEDEVDAAFDAGPPDLDAVMALRTLRRTTLEALRLHPMAIALPRVVAQPFEHEGYAFTPGMTIYVAGPVTHFLPEVFPDPDRFDPDRFAPGRSEHRRAGAFAPFGFGAHACMARAWSTTLAAVVVAGIVRAVRPTLDPRDRRLVVRAFPSPVPEARFRFRAVTRRAQARRREAAPSLDDSLATALAGLPPEAREAVFADLQTLELPAGTVVFRQGDAPDRFYLIRRGEVEVVVRDDVVRTLGPGSHFGELGILQGVGRTATVRTVGPTALLALGRDAFTRLAVEAELTSAQLGRLLERRAVLAGLEAALPDLDRALLERLGSGAERRTVPAGTEVVRHGDAAEHFFLLLGGQVQVVNPGPAGEEIVLAELAAPDHFGEIGLLEGRPRTATVRAAGGEVTVLALDRAAFAALLAGDEARGRGLAEVAAARLLATLART